MGAADSSSMLHFQKLDLYQRSIESLPWHIAYVNGCPRGMRTWPIDFVAPRSRFRKTSLMGCGPTTRADKAKHYTIARGSAMESASHLDVMRVDELIDAELYARGVELLERIVAMLTKLIDP